MVALQVVLGAFCLGVSMSAISHDQVTWATYTNLFLAGWNLSGAFFGGLRS